MSIKSKFALFVDSLHPHINKLLIDAKHLFKHTARLPLLPAGVETQLFVHSVDILLILNPVTPAAN